jgi:hypothetical protein
VTLARARNKEENGRRVGKRVRRTRGKPFFEDDGVALAKRLSDQGRGNLILAGAMRHGWDRLGLTALPPTKSSRASFALAHNHIA